MRLTTSLFQGEIEIYNSDVTNLVIENPTVMRKLVEDIYNQTEGGDGEVILFDHDRIVKMSKSVELVTTLFPFGVNEKRLLTKLCSILEKEAVNEKNYLDTMEFLAEMEKYLMLLAELFPCSVSFQNINIASIIKASGLTIVDDSTKGIERVFNYMNIVRDLLGEKLFIFVNLRAFFNSEDLSLFVDTVLAHEFHVLLIDNKEGDKINNIHRITVDNDLCVF